MRKISMDSLSALFEAISGTMPLFLPVDGKEGASYKKWEPGTEYSKALNTNKSAKDFFFPQVENMMAFKTEGKNIEVLDLKEDVGPFAIFGVRACDLASFSILDRVFLSDPVDSFYKARRDNAVIISVACSRPQETCFCSAFSIDAAAPGGDVECVMADGMVYLEAKTEKGEAFLKNLEAVTEASDERAAEAEQAKIRERIEKLPLANLSTDAFGGGKTMEYFNNPLWDELSANCLGCGTCTFVCPTCQCYDIKDYNTGKGVQRFRCWDSCMYSDFTKMAHGNIRNSQKERFRQRFMHKLVYFPENNEGIFGCVGCGRCLAKCPISMNIVKVMKTLGGADNA
ncbi:MAG: 4Fe-4S dicluster domain-containing protein [Clostridia bacterium]|nr:4Fe-4S dicluster domain-containing protein [Clostridia bacterium]